MITLTPTPCHLKKFVTPVKERLQKRLERDRKRGCPSLELNYLRLAYARTGNNLLLFDAVIQCKNDDYPVPDWLRDALIKPFSDTLNL